MARTARVLLAVMIVGGALAAAPADALARDSQLIGCDQADEEIVVTTNSHLDKSCIYTVGVEVQASDVTLDCRGALIDGGPDGEQQGIRIVAPATVAIRNVTVRNCNVRGFLNSIRIQRRGFKDLEQGEEYDPDAVFDDIVIEKSHFSESRGSGVFVDGYVTGVTLRNLEIVDSGGVGVYLEHGSAYNVVTRSKIIHNGYDNTDPAGIPFDLGGGVILLIRQTGREGIAVDGSRYNRISGNTISGNSYGGVFLYKNCGEDFTNRPNAWWERRYGADGNVIENNKITDTYTGVWVGSRQAENQYFMDCSDPAYIDQPLRRVHEDFAKDNIVRRNTFTNVQYGVRVEDDGNVIERNRFVSADPTYEAVLIGTKERTTGLGRPVDGTIVRYNSARITGNAAPYDFIHPHTDTVYDRNRSFGKRVELEPGTQPAINFHLFLAEILGPA